MQLPQPDPLGGHAYKLLRVHSRQGAAQFSIMPLQLHTLLHAHAMLDMYSGYSAPDGVLHLAGRI